jgi:rhamnosyltransferase
VSNIKHALIIAHYHREGKIRTDTVDAIKLFSGVFDRVILVSTNLQDAEKAKIHQDCEVIVRENVGYDFYSYRQGLLKILDDEGPVRVSLLNSSARNFPASSELSADVRPVCLECFAIS